MQAEHKMNARIYSCITLKSEIWTLHSAKIKMHVMLTAKGFGRLLTALETCVVPPLAEQLSISYDFRMNLKKQVPHTMDIYSFCKLFNFHSYITSRELSPSCFINKKFACAIKKI